MEGFVAIVHCSGCGGSLHFGDGGACACSLICGSGTSRRH